MTKEEIIRMAREAGLEDEVLVPWAYEIKMFATIVADAEAKRIYDEGMVTVGHMRDQIAAEREACAKLADDIDPVWESVSVAIRARGRP